MIKSIDNFPEYIVMDPTGNITVLVTDDVPESERLLVTSGILRAESSAEQLGYTGSCCDADISLEMSGGEFCGNATMCAAVYYCMQNEIKQGKVHVRVSGAPNPVPVSVNYENDTWACTVSMPLPLSIDSVMFESGQNLPVVHFAGIDHIICVLDDISDIDEHEYEQRIRTYCSHMKSLCCGMMLYDRVRSELRPLVYVPGADTIFWEHSCASGTAAIGAWEYCNSDGNINLDLKEPGGVLKVSCLENKILLSGTVRM